MKFKLSINSKILLYILGTSILVFILSLGYISYKFRQMALKNAKELTDAFARENANVTQNILVKYIGAIESIGQVFESFEKIDEPDRRAFFNEVLIKSLKENNEFISAWTTWESNSIDTLDDEWKGKQGSTIIGNYAVLYYKQGDIVVLDSSQETNPDEVFTGEYYNLPKERERITIMDPYYYSYSKDGRNKILETSVVVPIMKNYEFFGVVGLDVELETFKTITNSIKPFKDSYAFLVSNNGSLVTHHKNFFIGKNISEVYPNLNQKLNILENIAEGNAFSDIHDIEEDGNIYYVSFAPVKLSNSGTPWSLAIIAPLKSIYEEANRRFLYTLIIGLFSIVVLAVVSQLISKSITNPLEKIDNLLKKLNKANVAEIKKMASLHNDEIGEIAESAYALITWLNSTSDFAYELKNGNLNAEYKLINEDDVLGKSLQDLQSTLIEANDEEEKRRDENEQRSWATTGIAKFGEIARSNSNNMEQFTYAVISNLVKYLNANQGGIFIINNDDPEDIFMELTATFAYNKKKMLNKKIAVGEGLLGSCAQEKKSIYLKEIPDDYLEITSGLGDANPSYLLIVPLLLNDEVFGIMEIASFNEIEKYQKDFIEEIAKIIASTVNNVKINIQTNKLLEESKYSSEQLAQQEEEMRQNYEELQTTQEELVRTKDKTEKKVNDVITILDGLPYPLITTTEAGLIIDYNISLLKISGYQKGEIDNEPVKILFKNINPNQIEFKKAFKTEITNNEDKAMAVEVYINKIKKADEVNFLYTIKKI